MGKTAIPKAPQGTGPAGRKLWREVLGEYELEEHEMLLLREAVRTVDTLDALHKKAKPPIVDSPQGLKANPALIEARQQRIALARILAALRLPAGEEGDAAAGRRPQRRVGVRGTYNLKAV
jgi:hypothetical protein